MTRDDGWFGCVSCGGDFEHCNQVQDEEGYCEACAFAVSPVGRIQRHFDCHIDNLKGLRVKRDTGEEGVILVVAQADRSLEDAGIYKEDCLLVVQLDGAQFASVGTHWSKWTRVKK